MHILNVYALLKKIAIKAQPLTKIQDPETFFGYVRINFKLQRCKFVIFYEIFEAYYDTTWKNMG